MTMTAETFIARGKREILDDIADGRVPASVVSFSALHDYVDANEYAGLCDESLTAAELDFGALHANEIQTAIGAWLRADRNTDGEWWCECCQTWRPLDEATEIIDTDDGAGAVPTCDHCAADGNRP
jgi:hypothetical protein